MLASLRLLAYCSTYQVCSGAHDDVPEGGSQHPDSDYLYPNAACSQSSSSTLSTSTSGSLTLAGVDVNPLEEWAPSCTEGLRILLEQREHQGPDGIFRGVSLVAFKSKATDDCRIVRFISWSTEGVSGRICDLDDENYIKPLVCVGSKRVPLKLSELDQNIVWRDTDVRHIKAKFKQQQRQSLVPPHLLRLLDMWELMENPATIASARTRGQPTCFVCNHSQSNQLPAEAAKQCCLCLLATHHACTEKLLPMLMSCVRSGPASVNLDISLPIWPSPEFELLPAFQQSTRQGPWEGWPKHSQFSSGYRVLKHITCNKQYIMTT